MVSKLDKIRKERLSEVDDILDLFQGKLGLSDILNQDYSLITDLANVRDEKNSERLAQQKKLNTNPQALSDLATGGDKKGIQKKAGTTKSSAPKNNKKRSV